MRDCVDPIGKLSLITGAFAFWFFAIETDFGCKICKTVRESDSKVWFKKSISHLR